MATDGYLIARDSNVHLIFNLEKKFFILKKKEEEEIIIQYSAATYEDACRRFREQHFATPYYRMEISL
jgi:hypothetical protein